MRGKVFSLVQYIEIVGFSFKLEEGESMVNMKWLSDRNIRVAIRVLIFFAVISLAPSVLHADIVLQNVTGTISITTPDGKVITVEAGQPLPSIPSGSTIEVITGTAEISASGGDTVNVLINGALATVGDGASISVTVDLRTGDASFEVLTGSVSVTQPDGTTETVTEGSTFSEPAPTPASTESVDTPGSNPADGTGTQGDAQQGLIGGYTG